MSNYRRLISYIYAYEGDVKGKNIGFAKIESRNGQSKINVNVKKVYVGSNDMGVYLLSSAGEVLLGTIFIRNGNGEFRTSVQFNNVDGDGLQMDQCYGLSIHDIKDRWQSYTTIWEDAVAHAAEVTLRETEPARIQQPNFEPIIQEIEQEVAEQEALKEAEWIRKEQQSEQPPKQIKELENQTVTAGPVEIMDFSGTAAVLEEAPDLTETEPELLPGEPLDVELPEIEHPSAPEELSEPPIRPEIQTEKQPVAEEIQEQVMEPIGDQEELERLRKEEELEVSSPHDVWQKFRKAYPKIQAFDYERGCEIITIKPQDIGMLPRETWVYGNNSFLLHGYYNYRYLILAKLNNSGGMPRYLLGVPGHYYSNEKYMASMFGFPNFVLSKQQPAGDGRFGYWYTDIKLSTSMKE